MSCILKNKKGLQKQDSFFFFFFPSVCMHWWSLMIHFLTCIQVHLVLVKGYVLSLCFWRPPFRFPFPERESPRVNRVFQFWHLADQISFDCDASSSSRSHGSCLVILEWAMTRLRCCDSSLFVHTPLSTVQGKVIRALERDKLNLYATN